MIFRNSSERFKEQFETLSALLSTQSGKIEFVITIPGVEGEDRGKGEVTGRWKLIQVKWQALQCLLLQAGSH